MLPAVPISRLQRFQESTAWTQGFAQKALSAHEGGGKPHLPDPELIGVELVISAREAFNVKAIEEIQESRGRPRS